MATTPLLAGVVIALLGIGLGLYYQGLSLTKSPEENKRLGKHLRAIATIFVIVAIIYLVVMIVLLPVLGSK